MLAQGQRLNMNINDSFFDLGVNGTITYWTL